MGTTGHRRQFRQLIAAAELPLLFALMQAQSDDKLSRSF